MENAICFTHSGKGFAVLVRLRSNVIRVISRAFMQATVNVRKHTATLNLVNNSRLNLKQKKKSYNNGFKMKQDNE